MSVCVREREVTGSHLTVSQNIYLQSYSRNVHQRATNTASKGASSRVIREVLLYKTLDHEVG